MNIEKPIFVVGVGRSGSTVFHKILARHPQVCWLSRLCDKYPDRPSINGYLMQALDYPWLGRYLQRKVYPEECYIFWDRYCKGFSTPCRDLVQEDVTEKVRKSVHGVLTKMLTGKRHRLLVKVTGWPRVGFLREIFPDARFIHIVRDGRAVANSFINMDWWWGWRGPQNWRWGELTPEQFQEWERYNRSFLVLACLEWKILMDAMENVKSLIGGGNILEIKYEELCADPKGVFGRVINFCGLEDTKDFDRVVQQYQLENINDKWKNDLTGSQIKVMEEVLDGHLKKYGYR